MFVDVETILSNVLSYQNDSNSLVRLAIKTLQKINQVDEFLAPGTYPILKKIDECLLMFNCHMVRCAMDYYSTQFATNGFSLAIIRD